MNLSSVKRALWIIIAIAAVVLVADLLWIEHRAETSQNADQPSYRADLELTDHEGAPVDPARETVGAMADYVRYFHPAIRGLTGTPAELARAAAGFRVTNEKAPVEGGDYTMNHAVSKIRRALEADDRGKA